MAERSNPKYVRRLPDGRYEYGRIELTAVKGQKHQYIRHGVASTIEEALAKENMSPMKENA